MLHVYPLNDEREHVLEGTTCPCDPRVEWRHQTIVIHNAFDCREVIAEAERIKDQTFA